MPSSKTGGADEERQPLLTGLQVPGYSDSGHFLASPDSERVHYDNPSAQAGVHPSAHAGHAHKSGHLHGHDHGHGNHGAHEGHHEGHHQEIGASGEVEQCSDFCMECDPTIYSTALYSPAVMRIKTGSGCTTSTWRVAALILLNMLLQCGLLRVLDVFGHRDNQLFVQGLVAQGQYQTMAKDSYEMLLSPTEKDVVVEGKAGMPLCINDKGSLSCPPPSTRFISQWDTLDTDGDGEWTMAEALASEKSIAKKGTKPPPGFGWIAKKPSIVFTSIVNGLTSRSAYAMNALNQTLYISPSVRAKVAIPKAYFDFWVGDAMMCTHFDRYSCNDMVTSGLFDAALAGGRMGAAHKGIFDLDSGLKYCQMMLEDGGGCEQSLPPSFMQNSLHRRGMCGTSTLSSATTFVTNPDDASDVMPVMKMSFSKLTDFDQSVNTMFLFFKILIMFLFYSSLVEEIRDLVRTSEFLVRFDGLKDENDPGGHTVSDPNSECGKKYHITGIAMNHRIAMFGILFLRICIFCVLTSYGTWFLLNEPRYIELVLNALALSFITGIDEVLFNFVDEDDLSLDDVEPATSVSCIPGPETWLGSLYTKEMWGLVLIPLVSILMVAWNVHWVRTPLLDALTCSCTQKGDHCAESVQNQNPWWKNYWEKTLPAAVHHIRALQVQGI